MSLAFTKLHIFKTSNKIPVDPDMQIVEFIKFLDGQIKENWQVLSPSPSQRVIYFEMKDSSEARLVEGSMEDMRNMALGKTGLKKEPSKRRRKTKQELK